jgi:secreted trypsin-like serine protease
MQKLLVLAILTGASTGACASDAQSLEVESVQREIIGGVETREFPDVAVLRGLSAVETGCSATRIARSFLLTAGHCFSEGQTDASNVFAVFSPMTDTQAAEAWVGRVSVLSADKGANDLAVLEILNPDDVDRVAGKSALLKKGPLYAREEVTVVGWGCASHEWDEESQDWLDGPGRGTKRLRETTLKYNGNTAVTGSIGCRGDSGGPLFIGYGEAIGGVTSFVRRDDDGNETTNYADVVNNRGWIHEQVRNMGGPDDIVDLAVNATIHESEHERTVIIRQ